MFFLFIQQNNFRVQKQDKDRIKIVKNKLMSLKITADIFKWLQSLSLVKQVKRNSQLLEISEQNSIKFFDGISIGILLKNQFKHIIDQQSSKKLNNLKQNSNPAIRLYNWNILIQVLKKLKIVTIDNNQKSKIINLQYEPILKILKSLYQYRQKKSQQQTKGLKIDITQIHKKSLHQSKNALQFLIIILSKNFKLSPQHTLNLFIDNNKYLSHLIVKGVKNSFQPIYHFLNDLKINLEFLISHIFCIDEEQNVNFFFNALNSCLISKDLQTIQISIQLFNEIFYSYKMQGLPINYIKNWIKNQGINVLFYTIKKNNQFFNQIMSICYKYLQNQLFDLFQLSQKNLLWNNQKQKINFFRKIITIEIQQKQFLNKFLSLQLINQWFKYFVKNIKKIKNNQDIYQINLIFQTLWLKMQQKFEDDSLNLLNYYLQFLKQSFTSSNFLIFSNSIVTSFNLIKILGNKKNQNAPILYRMIINFFTNLNSNDSQKISFICDNLIIFIKQTKNVPGSQLINPIVNKFTVIILPQLLNLVKVLLQERRISEDQSIELLQILTKIVFQDSQYGQMAIQIIFDFIPTINDEIADQYLINNSKISLAQLYSKAKIIIKNLSQLKVEILNQQKNQENVQKKQIIIGQLKKIIICHNSVKFLIKYLELNDINLKNSLEDILFNTYVKIKVQLKKKKIADLLLPLMKQYYQNQDQLQQRITECQKQFFPQPKQKQNSRISIIKSINLGKSLDLTQTNSQKYRSIDPSTLSPSKFAIKHLQTLKQRKQQFKSMEIQKQNKQLEFEQKQKRIKNFINQKRMIQFGAAGKMDYSYKGLFQFDSMKEQEVIQGISLIKLVNFEKQQEQTYSQDLFNIIKKYRKVWRFLFFKYSSNGAKKQQLKVQQKIHMSEIWKMLRQYQLFPFIKKEESQMIIKLINDLMKRKNDPQHLTYPGFEQYLMQLCFYSYKKYIYPHLPPSQQILLFINQLKYVTKQKGGNVQLFQNPQDIYFQQTDVIKQYNRRLRNNPEYILPEGYKKYKQTNIEYDYNIHPMLTKNFNLSFIDVTEILNQIFYQKLKINLLEPLSVKNEITLAKPVLFQNINQKMKQYKKGYLQPKSVIIIKDDSQIQTMKPLIIKKQIRPMINFSLGIKLGLSQLSIKDKSLGQQVAYWMHDMLNAVVNQSSKVQNLAKKRIENQIIKKRKFQSLENVKKQTKQKKQWRKRAQSVKTRLQIQKKQKQEQNQKNKEQQIIQKRKKRLRQEQYLKKRLKRYQQMKKVLSQRKQQQKYRKIQEQQKRKQKMAAYKQKVQEYFQNKKQQILNKEQVFKKIKQEQQKQKIIKQQKKQKFMNNVYLNNLKKQEQLLQKSQKIKQEYNELWKSNQIEKQFKKYQKQLNYLFNLLLKHQKSKISATKFDQIGLNTLHFFTVKFLIVPFLIEKNELIKIFNYVVKENQKRNKKQSTVKQIYQLNVILSRPVSPGLNFKNFEQLLFGIAIKAKSVINKIIKQRKKKLQKLTQSIKSKKSQNGNHFEVQQIQNYSQFQQNQQQKDQAKHSLLDDYLFDVSNVDNQVLSQLLKFLKLPKDKIGVEERYRSVIEMKNIKPKKVIIKELMEEILDINIQNISDKQIYHQKQSIQ